MNKLHIKKGDIVMVGAGGGKGKTGRILKALVKKQCVVVEELNMVSKHIKPNAQSPQGAILSTEAPIYISNLNVLDPQSGKGTRIGHHRGDNDKLVRFARKSGEVIR